MKHCSSCQRTYTDDSIRFCTADGMPLDSQSASLNIQPSPFVAESSQPQRAPQKPSSWGLGSLLGKSAAPQIAVQLDRPQGLYHPGDTVRAAVTISAQEAAGLRSIGCGLIFTERCATIQERTKIDEDRHRYKVDEVEWRDFETWVYTKGLIGECTLPAGFSQTYRLDWALPTDAPPTYAGDLVKLTWQVRVMADLPMAEDLRQDTVVAVAAPLVHEHQPPVITPAPANNLEDIHIQLWLPKTEYIEGEMITGKVLLEPRRDTKARAVRLYLNHYECVLIGDSKNERSDPETAVVIASEMQLRAGASVALDFALPIPFKWRPHYRTGRSYNSSRICAEIDVPWRPDNTGCQEIFIYTAPAR